MTNEVKETKEQRFTRLATARVNKAIKAIQTVGKLAALNTFEGKRTEYATKIVGALVAAVDVVEARFQPQQKEDEKPGFAL